MNKLFALLALCVSFILLAPSIELEPEKLFIEITGFLSEPLPRVPVTLKEIRINAKKFSVTSDYYDETDSSGKFKLEYAVPFDSIGLKKTNPDEQLQAKSAGILDWFKSLFSDSKEYEQQTVSLTLSAKIRVDGKDHQTTLPTYKGTLDSLYDSKLKKYILRWNLSSSISID